MKHDSSELRCALSFWTGGLPLSGGPAAESRYTENNVILFKKTPSRWLFCRQMFLTDDDFNSTFGMTKDEYGKLPEWKRINLKKQHQLFWPTWTRLVTAPSMTMKLKRSVKELGPLRRGVKYLISGDFTMAASKLWGMCCRESWCHVTSGLRVAMAIW